MGEGAVGRPAFVEFVQCKLKQWKALRMPRRRVAKQVVEPCLGVRVFLKAQPGSECRLANRLPDFSRRRQHQVVLAAPFFQSDQAGKLRAARIEIAPQRADDPDAQTPAPAPTGPRQKQSDPPR